MVFATGFFVARDRRMVLYRFCISDHYEAFVSGQDTKNDHACFSVPCCQFPVLSRFYTIKRARVLFRMKLIAERNDMTVTL